MTRWPASSRKRRRGTWCTQLCTELLRLDQSPPDKIGSGDSGRKAEVVLDARAGTCLAARRHHVEPKGPQTFRGPVHRRGETGWSPANHHQVEDTFGQASERQAEILRQDARARPTKDDPRRNNHRQFGRLDAELTEKLVHLRVAVRIEPLVGHPAARQELAELERLWRVASSDDSCGDGRAVEQIGAPSHESGQDSIA